MAKIRFQSVDDYLAAQPEPARLILAKVRQTIRKAIPGAEEKIAYQMPAYYLPGGPVLYFAGWKKHYSVYPVTRGLLDAFGGELTSYSVEKGTIRFPLDAPVPLQLIQRIARFRASEVESKG